jgi:glycosyltransferase involved in cell wall biosynthesis
MKIAIDARMIGIFMHGISRYAYNLIKSISEIDKKNEYVLLSNNNYLEDFVSSYENFSLKVINSRLYGMREQFSFPRLLKKEKIDIFHSPSFFGPVFGSCKVIMTIHDMIPLLFREESSIMHKEYYRFIVKRAAKNASRIITVSENSRRDIANYLSIPLEKIVVTYNAVDEVFRRNNEGMVDEIKDRFGINDGFILYVGTQKPHKNVSLLIEAYQQLRGRINHQLIIAGRKHQLFQRSLSKNMLEGVIFVGEVSDEFLSQFYRCADIYVSPSLYEGFGFPPLEAMACGTAVVAIRSPSLGEILGDVGYIVEGNQPEELASAIYKVLLNGNIKKDLVEKGLERVKLFSWKETANKTVKIYEDVFKE